MTKKYNAGVAESNRKRVKHGGAVNARQGQTDRVYEVWKKIKERCNNPNSQHYHRYGGRGITMCQRWVNDFAAFREDVGEPPSKAHTLDRIDNDGNYEPSNVRWSTRKEQANNRSTNVVLTHNGLTMTLMQWSEHLGWKYGLIASRWKNGLRGDELFAEPKHERNKVYEYKGQYKTLAKWAEETGVSYNTLVWRVKNGKDLL